MCYTIYFITEGLGFYGTSRTCFGTSTLWSESSIWKFCWCIRPTKHVQDCHYCKKPGHMIADSRKRQNANSRRQSDTAHLAALPETPTESETFQSPYRIGPLKHYFYDLRSTPTPDTDSFTPRQRKQIQRLNPSCHISSSSATGICSPLCLQHRGLLTFFGCIEEYDWWFFTSFFSSFSI